MKGRTDSILLINKEIAGAMEHVAHVSLRSWKVRVEGMALKKQAAPPNYRWACRVQIAPDATQGGVVKVKLRPQTAVWDDGVTR
eukprot:gene35241-45635_t